MTIEKLKTELFNFFIWFRINGEKYIGVSTEKFIDIYIEEQKQND